MRVEVAIRAQPCARGSPVDGPDAFCSLPPNAAGYGGEEKGGGWVEKGLGWGRWASSNARVNLLRRRSRSCGGRRVGQGAGEEVDWQRLLMAPEGFHVLPRRCWVVERTFSRIDHNRGG